VQPAIVQASHPAEIAPVQPKTTTIIPVSRTEIASPTSSLGFAPDYSWLTGQVEYSRLDNAWRLRYCIPGEEDSHGGVVTLLGLGDPKEDQVVTVYGRLVEQKDDSRTPTYRVESYRVVQSTTNR